MAGKHVEPDYVAMRITQELLTAHTEAYFCASERQRVQVYRLIDDAWRMSGDVLSDLIPGGEWRHDWPEPARAALLALWSTPH
jgi:hypothetical protein